MKEMLKETPYERIKGLKKRMKMSDKKTWGMIETLFRNGYEMSEIAFLTQVGQAYSLAMHDIQAKIENEKLNP